MFGIEQHQLFRDELGIASDLRAATTGRYKMGEDYITGYTFDGPYRGIVHGYDPEPLRADTITAGVPHFVEPTVATAVTNGYGSRPNSAWVEAPYEVGFLFGQDSFNRLVPSYQQVAGWNFPSQLVNGSLEFRILEDADCNLFRDFGVHLYQIERAFEPRVPHAVTAILYKRCTANLGLISCTD